MILLNNSCEEFGSGDIFSTFATRFGGRALGRRIAEWRRLKGFGDRVCLFLVLVLGCQLGTGGREEKKKKSFKKGLTNTKRFLPLQSQTEWELPDGVRSWINKIETLSI